METIYISIIEKDTLTRDSLTTYLQIHDGISLGIVSSSITLFLIDLYKNGSPEIDLLLLDINQLKESGIDQIKELKKKLPGTDIILLTTFEEENKIFPAIRAGAVSYISKRKPLANIKDSIFSIYRGGSFMSPSLGRKVAQHFASQNNQAVKITPRQYQIVKGITDGLSYQNIANKHEISINSVRDHIKKVYKALHINSKGELIKKMMGGQLSVRN